MYARPSVSHSVQPSACSMIGGVLVHPALLLGERMPQVLAVEGAELVGGRHVPDGSPDPDGLRTLSPVVSRRPIELLAAVVGAASLGAEIAAARLLAPWFGASTIVWANTIATVLVALSAGYWVGGRLADRDPSLARPLPHRARSPRACSRSCRSWPSRSCASPSTRSTPSQAGAFVGSLIGVLVLVAVPVMLLGAVAPYAVRLSVHAVEEAGRVAGRLYAISTLGSLVGTFLSALVLIPLVGHPAHVPRSSRSRSPSPRCRLRGAAASLGARRARRCCWRSPSARSRPSGERPGHLGEGDRVPVRARRRGAADGERRAGAQRGPGGALDLRAGRRG